MTKNVSLVCKAVCVGMCLSLTAGLMAGPVRLVAELVVVGGAVYCVNDILYHDGKRTRVAAEWIKRQVDASTTAVKHGALKPIQEKYEELKKILEKNAEREVAMATNLEEIKKHVEQLNKKIQEFEEWQKKVEETLNAGIVH